ncbi:MAG: hypothetical protein ABSH38_21375 [Verrucomicrobiota bacterium]
MKFQNVLTTVALGCALGAGGADSFELTATNQDALRRAGQGSVLPMPELVSNWRREPAIPIARSVLPGPRLLFSDMPEYLGEQSGVCMAEDVTPGGYRLYVYHVPGATNSPRTVSAMIENLSPRPLRVRFTRCAFPPPGTQYAVMGVEGLIEFFTGQSLPPPLSLPPLGKEVLDRRLDETAAADPQLVHALYEFEIDEPARVSVFQRETNQAGAGVFSSLEKLPRQLPGRKLSGAGRGLFPDADLAVTNAPGSVIDTSNGIQRLVLADGRSDPWVLGTDGLAGNLAVTNKGSYGVVYHVKLAYTSSDGRALAILVAGPGRRRSGEARPMAALEVSDGVWKGGWQKITGGAGARERGAVAVVQELAPPARGTTNFVELVYSPPGGSSLPTPIFFAPFWQ